MIDWQAQIDQAASQLIDILRDNNYSISAAESCSGGLLAAGLTEAPGSSQWFAQSWVTYSIAAKQALGVSDHDLRFGVVSAELAAALAHCARRQAQSDIGLSISGNAGPSLATPNSELGLVYFGVALGDSFAPLLKSKLVAELAVEPLKQAWSALLADSVIVHCLDPHRPQAPVQCIAPHGALGFGLNFTGDRFQVRRVSVYTSLMFTHKLLASFAAVC